MLFPVRRAERAVSTFPCARFDVVPGAGLVAHEERPEQVARLLLPTLSS